MDTQARLSEFMPIIVKVARRVAGEHYVVEAEDLQQELVVLVLEREDLPLPSEVSWISGFLTRCARMYAFNQKQQHYMLDANESYEVRDIKRILETHFNRSHWTSVQENESVEDKITAHSDVAWALDRLKVDDKAFVAECYTAPRLPASGTKEYRRLRDIIIKVANMLNHYTRADEGQGPGRRRAVPNSQARAIIGADI